MAVSFNRIPPNLRVPLFWAEFDPTQASYLQTPQPACLLGHKVDSAPAEENTPLLVSSVDVAAALFGSGSMLTDMVGSYRLQDPTGELWCVVVPAPAGGASAVGQVAFSGTPTAAATMAVYVGDRRYSIPVTPASTLETIGGALVAAITADPFAPCAAVLGSGPPPQVTLDLPQQGGGTVMQLSTPKSGKLAAVSAAVASGILTITPAAGSGDPIETYDTTAGGPYGGNMISVFYAINSNSLCVEAVGPVSGSAVLDEMPTTAFPAAPPSPATVMLTAHAVGSIGNSLFVGMNLRGLVGGEYVPAGLTVTVTPFAGGAGDPDVTAALAALADTEYDFVCCPWSDPAALDACQVAFGETAGRWAWNIQLYGHVFSARAGTPPDLVTFGKTRNDPHLTLMGYPANSPSPAWKVAAALTGEAAVGLRADPARPLQTLPLVGILFAPRGQRFTVADAQSLLFAGIATGYAGFDDVVHIQRSITTYQRDAWGLADPSWLDVQTPATLQLIVRETRNRILTKFPRAKLADDGTRLGAGQAVVTPSTIRAELVALYSELEEAGLAENMAAFKRYLIVERDATDPNRVNVLFPPDLVNQLRIFAMLVQFRLQYPTSAVAAAA